MQPNGVRALEALGIRALPGSTLQGLQLRSSIGRHLSQTPIGHFRKRYGTELIVVPRSDLHSLLMETVGRDRVKAAAEVTGYEIGTGRMTVNLRDGRRLEADLLIGANGLRSAVRDQLLGDGEPQYLGCSAWRATTDLAGSGLQVGQGLNWWGPRAEFGVLPMGRAVYWFSTANVPRGGEDPPGGERIQALLDRFGGWEAPIAAIISSGTAEGPDIGSGLVAYERRRLSRANGFVWVGWAASPSSATGPSTQRRAGGRGGARA
jgi:2-polyprenyl-6-methoxyphenol hydroxylase-like FAD-dependent oxidoreductase